MDVSKDVRWEKNTAFKITTTEDKSPKRMESNLTI